MTVKAIYENGVFRPTQPVNLPERAEVQVVLPAPSQAGNGAPAGDAVYALLRRSYATGQTDTAARHNEHQP